MDTWNADTLIDERGRPRFGIYSVPPSLFNLEDFRPYGSRGGNSLSKRLILAFRMKRWQYLGVCNDDIIFGVAVVRLGYLCNLFAYLFDRRTGTIDEYNIIRPGGKSAVFQGTSNSGTVAFTAGRSSLAIINGPATVSLKGTIGGKLSVDLGFERYAEPLVCLTRAGLKGFNYTHKEAGFAGSGKISSGEMSWNIDAGQSCGVFDYTLGYLSRHTFWNWAAGGGIDSQENRVGFNCVQGINETGFTENAFWINGRLFKVDVVHFRYDDGDFLKPWDIASNDGRVTIRFVPEGIRSANIQAGLFASRFSQPFGRFQGSLRGNGMDVQLADVSGFTEEHYARW
ncbi:MAG TPA: DUF2804 domain-containing protein [Deltaproteobacteria bacterium]|nr:DUF2804 domain-containing protein [Deltaproteobacteria bacterium]